MKEVFSTLQGEGYFAGRAAVFVRFSGCNLWDGTEAGRATGKAPCAKWCDTDFVGGEEYTRDALIQKMLDTWRGGISGRFVVFTGGEPTLQLDEELLKAARASGFFCAVETNGLKDVPPGVDWLTVSPKTVKINVVGNELKLVYPTIHPAVFEDLSWPLFYLQPLDNHEKDQNTLKAIEYIKEHPKWRLSTQMHKTVGIP